MSPTPRTVGAFGTPKGKSGKFLIIISSIPAAQAEYSATNVIRTVGAVAVLKKATVSYLPIRPLHFTGGQKLAHTRVN